MVPLLSVIQARDLDERTQKEYKISAEVLIKIAGEKAAELFAKHYPDKNSSIGVLCGNGNNAGDGLVMGQKLLELGYDKINFYMLFPTELWRDSLKKSANLVPSQRVRLGGIENLTEIKANSLLIDAVFGIGLSRKVEDSLAKIFSEVNRAKIPVVALDIASGLSADTGEILGAALRCERTYTFGWAKLGQFLRYGAEFSGTITRLDIGFPKELSEQIAKNYFLVRRKDIRRLIPERTRLGNKTNYGHVKVWAGSPGFLGARVLVARAAFRAGAGYVTLENEDDSLQALEFLPEAMTKMSVLADNQFTYAVGPGLGINEKTKLKIQELYNQKIAGVVLDADALTVMAQHQLPVLPSWILTPHTGELRRLLEGVKSEDIEKDRIRFVQLAAKKFGCVILLKGYRSLVAFGDQVYIVPTGNSALAKAGSGDVLTGIITSFRAQGLKPADAALCGAYIHGAVADHWIKNNDIRGLTPSDLLLEIPKVMKWVAEKSVVKKVSL